MTIAMNVAIRVKRILKPLKRFRYLDCPPNGADIGAFGEGETCIGVYENDDKNSEDCIIITDRGLLILSSAPGMHILFADIADVRSPSKRHDDYTLWLILTDGAEFPLEIRGTQGAFRDVYEFVRFLDRVVGDVRSSGADSTFEFGGHDT